ncbi:MAG: 50S ribosomal protein L11 methyltransferase [Ruminococcus sp.]|nr:50S ribosomal protein L11 methyltransferase [Ruminococcus sp.]
MNWTEVSIFTSTEGIEPVCGRLLNVGVTGFVIKDSKDFEEFLSDKSANWDYIDDDLMNLKNCETTVTFYLADNSQGADMLAMVRSGTAELKSMDKEGRFGRLEVSLSNVKEEDWANNWKQYFKPIEIGSRLLVKPSWETYEGSGRTVLEIDPASSFGTGQHNTTRLVLELLEKTVQPGARVLDIGCGSGILSIAALLLGADSAAAADIDLNSVNTARENAEKNRIPPEKYITHCGNIITDERLRQEIGGGFDIITANIVADVIIAMSGLFKGFLKEDGIVIVSGIITERADEVTDCLKEQGFAVVTVRESEGWAAVECRRQ